MTRKSVSGLRVPLFPTMVGWPAALPGTTGLDGGDSGGDPGAGLHSPRDLGPGLQELASPICSADLAAVETNMVMVRVLGPAPRELCRRLQAVSADEAAQTGRAVRVLLSPWSERSVRAVWHRDVSAQDTELALRKWGFVLRQLGALRTG